MDKLLDVLVLGKRSFHDLSMRGRVVLSQMPLNLTLGLVWGIMAFVHEEPMHLEFLVGQGLGILLLGLCAALPWDRIPYGLFLVIPFLDLIPIALVRASAADVVPGLGLLAVFPMMWLAGSGIHPKIMVPAGGVAVLLMVWLPLLGRSDLGLRDLVGELVTPFLMLAIAVAVSVMTKSGMEQQSHIAELLERSEMRERILETILDTVDVGVVAFDADGRDILFNLRLRDFYRAALPEGADDAPEAELVVVDEATGELVPPRRRPAARAIAGEVFTHEIVRLGRGKTARTVSVSARPLGGAEAGPAGTVLAFSDVTDVVAAVRAKDSFVASMSHEFRTPLTSIRGYAELLLDDPALPAGARADVLVIDRSARHLQLMVDEVLAAATGTVASVLWTPIDLAELVREAAASATPEAASRGISFQVRTSGDVRLHGDRTAMIRTVDNLVSNAIKYSGDGREVRLSTARENGWVVLTVSDDGIGMSQADVNSVFTRFHRSSAAKVAGIPGIGLGMALAREVAEQHGGRLECVSRLGEGTTFTLRIPGASMPPQPSPGAGTQAGRAD
ncbi:sensor histidine kinase [Sinomonas mesophila]|uniref:sensor histidine kinase n=1 Tax=Sinomonas mesophila TaxID=1531955 RepID=UPI000984E4A5|nr:HAMP domain-containing sensor histidine kinase [Sinomonas mesophila]